MFFDSFHRECGGDYKDIKIVVVDFYADEPGRRDEFAKLAHSEITHVTPKPSVWQGKHRLTSKDYFAASNARNTAVCYAPDGWIAYVDDLSYLMPGWLACVRDAIAQNTIACGAYKKVRKLEVLDDGTAAYEVFAPGIDSRLNHLPSGIKPTRVGGSWMFGCSVAMPVEALLKINGFDEDCDSLGSEDYIAGIMLERSGCTFTYDPRMMTLESEEAHHDGSSMPRFDKGKSPNDKSHAILNMVLNGRNTAPNYFGEGGLRALRDRILNGGQFPISQIPQHDWFDGQPLSEL